MAQRFRRGFAGVAAVAFVATVPAAPGWSAAMRRLFDPAIRDRGDRRRRPRGGRRPCTRCGERFATRLVALAALGVVAAATVVLFFPQCLADPYAGLDPRLQEFWLTPSSRRSRSGASLRTIRRWPRATTSTPLIGLVVLAGDCAATEPGAGRRCSSWRFWPPPSRSASGRCAARCSRSRFAAIPLAAWVGDWRAASRRHRRIDGDAEDGARLAGFAERRLERVGQRRRTARSARRCRRLRRHRPGRCDRASDYAALAALPATTVLADLQSRRADPRHTHHRVLAGPYHRNVAGDCWRSRPSWEATDEAAAIVGANGVGLVVLCRGNDETGCSSRVGAGGFIAALVDGERAGMAGKAAAQQPATRSKSIASRRQP